MRLLIALLLLVAPVAALAGQRAVYLDEEGKKMTIEVTDEGNAVVRNEGKPDQYGVWRDGQFYLVSKEEGEWKVARAEDIAAAFDQVLPPIFKALFGAASAKTPKSSAFRVVPKGKRKVIGHEGQVYAVYGIDDSKPEASKEVVISTEPALRPVGKAMEQFLVSTTMMMAPLIGKVAAEIGGDIRALFAFGTPIAMEGSLNLVSFETADVPAAAAALPAKPKTVAEIVKEVKMSGTGGQ